MADWPKIIENIIGYLFLVLFILFCISIVLVALIRISEMHQSVSNRTIDAQSINASQVGAITTVANLDNKKWPTDLPPSYMQLFASAASATQNDLDRDLRHCSSGGVKNQMNPTNESVHSVTRKQAFDSASDQKRSTTVECAGSVHMSSPPPSYGEAMQSN